MKNSIILALCALNIVSISAMNNIKEEYTKNFKNEPFHFMYCDNHCSQKEDLRFSFFGYGRKTIVVKDKKGNYAAFASFGKSDDAHRYGTNEKPCLLGHIMVMEEYQKQGIGKELFQQALQKMIDRGCRTIEWNSLPNAVPFYKKMGIPDNAFSSRIGGPATYEKYETYGAHVKYQVPFELIKNPTWSEKMKHKLHERFK